MSARSSDSATIRPPAVAGGFYPSDGADAVHLIERCFKDRRGPGAVPPPRRSGERRTRAIIVPHAGWVYSGAIAAHAYLRVAAERPPPTVLLLGVNHHGRGAPAALSDQTWETPLGRVPVDSDLLRALARGPVEVDNSAHELEHSLEVEVPWLQYVLPKPQIVALSVSMGPLSYLEEVADVVRHAIRGRDLLLLASTDFSHYVPAETARRLDRLALGAIESREAERLYDVVAEHRISMCGIAPTTVLLAALRSEPLASTLLRWGHSGEVESMTEVVGYAALTLDSAAPLGASRA